MKHTVCINIAKPGGRPMPVVKSRTVGKEMSVLVLSPGDTVQTVEIRELKEGGKERG